MKSVLALLVFVGVAWCNSTNYNAWTPNKELVYRFQSQVLTGIPEIRDSQYAGIRLSAQVRVQAFSDYSLRVKFEKTRFLTVNGDLNLSEGGRLNKGSETEQGAQEAEIPSELKSQLEAPFLVHMKRGIVESFFVEANEPQSITNIKRSFLSQIQLDLSASRRNEIQSNHVQQQIGVENNNEEMPMESNKDITYFTTREESILGDCQTSYTVHELPKYRSIELEQHWQNEEQMLYQEAELQSKGKEVCQGKQYLRITKTKNLDNCHKRPFFQNFVGLESPCDSSKASCADQYNHLVSTSCVVCGDLDEFVIRKCLKKDIVTRNPMGWNTEENIKSSATVSLELLKEESSFSPINTPSNLEEKKSLIFEFPESNTQASQEQVDKHTDQSGIRAVLPQPDLLSAPKMLFTIGNSKEEIIRQVVNELKRIAAEVFESPESCSSEGDAAGHLASVAKYLLPLSYEDLKAIKEEIKQSNENEGSKKVLNALFFDILSTVGSNPSTMMIKKEIENGDLTGSAAINALESAMRAVRTPTKELLIELVQLVKNTKNLEWNEPKALTSSVKDLYSVGMVQMSKLLFRACIHPVRRMTEFPIRIYGHFCSNESSIITENWVPYLEQELESTSKQNQEDEHYRLVAIASIGKLGHIKGLNTLVKAIDGSISKKPMVRSIAVYSLKRIARQNPALVKPILLSIIDNPAENTQVRIAAVSVLPWSQPSMAQLQKIAARTWFEPSKQVASFIHSTLKNLVHTQVPELKVVGQKASSVINMVKPFQFGAQFSQNINFANFVNYLKTSMSKKASWVFNEQEIVPAKMAMSNNFYNSGFIARGLSFSVYTQGMDYLVDRVLYYTNKKSPISETVKQQLEKITEELNIERPQEQSAEVFIQSRMAGYERLYSLNKDYIMEILEQTAESLRQNPRIFSEGRHFEYTRALQVLEIQNVGPTSAGFLRFSENIMPVVYSVKGFIKGENPTEGSIPVPTKVTARLMPIVNAKIHSSTGVICPFTQQLIGAGVDAAVHLSAPLEAEVKIDNFDQVSIVLKNNESVKKPIELLHAYITPYTVKKNLKTVQPMSKASNLNQIVSKNQLKKIDLDLGKKLGLSAKLIAESDAKYVDLYSYWEKIQQHSPLSLASLALLPSSVRKTSAKIVFNPNESETKEFAVRFSLAQGHNQNENQEEQVKQADEKLIKKVCNANYQPESQKNQLCQEKLKNLESISRKVEQVCEQQNLATEADRMRCHKTVQICEKAVKVCEERNRDQSRQCKEVKESCLDHVHNKQALQKKLQQKGQNTQLNRLNIQAALKGRNGEKSVATNLSFGSTIEEQGRVAKYYAEAEIELPQKSAQYEVAYESKVVFPKINHRWNTKQLLEEELKMELEGKIRYGKKDNMKEINFKSSMEKSEEQRQAVRQSPEYVKCAEHEQQNNILSSTCMKVRHQAASIDRIQLKIELPQELNQQPAALKLEEYIKALFVSQLNIVRESSNRSPKEINIVLDLARAGDEAQLKVDHSGLQWTVKNIRLPHQLKGILPLSMRNRIAYRLVQKITHNQAPASCRVEPDHIATFDNKTFHYELNECMHLLFKDCSGRVPVAVLAKSVSGPKSAKIVEILSGITKATLKPKSIQEANGLAIDLKVQEQEKSIELANGQIHLEKCPKTGDVLVEIKRYTDNVYNIWFHKEMLQIITDGLRIEIVAPQLVHGRTCGLCGDFNGESTADLKSPRKCLMENNRFFAYSYMLNKEGSNSHNDQCSGIPTAEREEFEIKAQKTCIKKQEIFTPLNGVVRHLQTLANPLISVHLVKKQANQLCVSRQMVKICSPKKPQEEQVARNFLEGNLPVEVKPKLVQFSCVDLPSEKAFSLERRAKRGDNLQAELNRLPIHFTNTEYEPVLCNAQTKQQQQQQQQRQQQNQRQPKQRQQNTFDYEN